MFTKIGSVGHLGSNDYDQMRNITPQPQEPYLRVEPMYLHVPKYSNNNGTAHVYSNTDWTAKVGPF